MTDPSQQGRVLRILLVLAALVVITAGMKASAAILVPFLLSVFIAVISAPPLFWMERKGLPLWLAMLIVLAGIIGFGFLMAVFAGRSVDEFSRSMPLYQEKLHTYFVLVTGWLEALGVEVPQERLREAFNPASVMHFANSILNSVGNVLSNALLILFTVSFMLFEASSFPRKLRAMSSTPDRSVEYFGEFFDSIKKYMGIKTVVSIMTGVIIALWLTILGVSHPVLWGVLAFFLNYVPTIGSIIAALPAVLLALIELGAGSALLVAGGFLSVNVLFGNVLEPRMMGRGVGLSALVVFLSLVFWGWLLGPVGMILSVPLTMMLKLALENCEETRWLALLLGTDAAAGAALEAGGSPPGAAEVTEDDSTGC